jgi:amino acid permease
MNYQIGAGILGLAFAFACAGLAGGLFLLILIGLMTLASFLYLLKCAEISKQYSLERLGFHSGGKVFAVVVNLFIIIDSFGPLSAYLTVGADVVLRFVEPVVTDPSNPIRSRPLIIFLILVFIVLPLSLLRSIRLLEFTSAVSIIPIVYLIGVQIYYISVSPPLNTAAITAFGSNFFYAFPIM